MCPPHKLASQRSADCALCSERKALLSFPSEVLSVGSTLLKAWNRRFTIYDRMEELEQLGPDPPLNISRPQHPFPTHQTILLGVWYSGQCVRRLFPILHTLKGCPRSRLLRQEISARGSPINHLESTGSCF